MSDERIISLEPEDPLAENFVPNTWTENAFNGDDADHLVGERKGKKTDPWRCTVYLTWPATITPPLTSCGSIAFSAPRIAEGGNTQVIPTSWHGHHYSRLVLAPKRLDFRLESFQIPGTSPAVKRVNTELAMGFPGLDPNTRETDVLTCSRSNLAWSGRDGGDTEIRWPEILTDTILVIGTSYDVYCGGAYPEMSRTWQVLYLETGEELDPRTWQLIGTLEDWMSQTSNIDADPDLAEDPPFHMLFLQHYPDNPTGGGGALSAASNDVTSLKHTEFFNFCKTKTHLHSLTTLKRAVGGSGGGRLCRAANQDLEFAQWLPYLHFANRHAVRR